MHVMIIGAAGMIGRKLSQRLAREKVLAGKSIAKLTLADIEIPNAPDGLADKSDCVKCDVSTADAAEDLVATRPDIIFHLAAVVSGEAESDFEKGYKINLDGTRALFEAIRLAGNDYCPRMVFTSSIAVFGAPFPKEIGDDFILAPLTSYGTQKAICELLLSDYSRRGFMDGVGVRLPTICIRPGKPNKAASGFFSNILREPLNGEPAILPVSEAVRHWFASPRAAVGFLIHAAELDTKVLGDRRNLTMPGLSATVGDEIEALKRLAGDRAVALIRREHDTVISRIVEGWPRAFNTARAEGLGFRPDATFDSIIQAYIEDDDTQRRK
jgi:nucleoside-diphosphate-sugar epimerase